MKNIYLQQRRTTASVMDNTGSMGKTVTMEGISPDGHMKPPSEKKKNRTCPAINSTCMQPLYI